MGAGDKLAQMQAPRLHNGGIGYAAWRDNMDVFLQRAGAEGIHRKVMTEAAWTEMSRRVEEWSAEAFDAAMALVSGSTTGSSSIAAPLSAEMKEARKVVSLTVERSRKVYGTLYSALPEELRAQVAHMAQGWAYGLWHWLETKFQSTEQDSVGELLAQWTTLRQEEDETFDAYRARVTHLNSLLAAAKEKPSARMFSYMMLDRLQPRFKQAVLALKAGGQLKDAESIAWDTVTAFVNSHERNEMRLDTQESGAHAMAVSYSRPPGAKPWLKAASAGAASSSIAGSKTASFGFRAAPPSREQRHPRTLTDVQCFNCKEFGHLSRQCLKERKNHPKEHTGGKYGGRGGADRGNGHRSPRSSSSAAAAPESDRTASAKGSNRYDTLSDEEGSTDLQDKHPDGSKMQCRAATVYSVSVASERRRSASGKKLHSPGRKEAVGLDSMSSLHICGKKSLFTDLKKCDPVSVQMADDGKVVATHKGKVTLQVPISGAAGKVMSLEVHNVYFHERFSATLLSWNKLRVQGWELHSTKDTSFLKTPGGNKMTLSTHGLVSVLECEVMESTPVKPGAASSHRVFGVSAMGSTKVAELLRLHQRLGHASFDNLVKIIKTGATLDVGKFHVSEQVLRQARERIQQCPACAGGKGHRTAFGHRGLDRGLARGEVLHMDTFVVRRSSAPADSVPLDYGLTVTDGFTKWRWFRSTKTKDQLTLAVIDIVRNAQTQMNCKVRRLHADGGTEFVNQVLKSFCAKEGIELHYPPARTQQLNGVAESAVRWTKDATRTLLRHSRLPTAFWVRAACHSTFVWNRTQLSNLMGMTPFEAVYGRKPSAKHWGVFGCDAFYHIPKEQRGASLAPKMEPCIYVGHDNVQNCAVVYSLRLRKSLRTRDVVFRNTSFTHGAALVKGDEDVQKILDGDHENVESDPDLAASDSELPELLGEEAAPQGGRDSEQPNSGEELLRGEDSESVGEEWEVERIVGQRRRRGVDEFKVRWAGSSEETWEPASMMKEDAPELVNEYLATRVAPRQSPRLHLPAASVGSEDNASDSELDAEPRVHMAMSAMRELQMSDHWLQHDPSEVVCAVSAGVALLEQQTPATFSQAMAGPDAAKWRAGMDKEMASCEELKVWDLVPRSELPHGANVLPPKWVYKIKTDETGRLTQHKARVTPKGFKQKAGQDYFEVFARTGMYKSMRLGLSLAAKWDHELEQLDVPTAFLNADVEEEVYMELPEGYRDGKEGMVCRLRKALYGLKQAPRNWYLLISKFITSLGFKATTSDPCLLHMRSRTGRLILLFLFVDDFQVSFHREDSAEWGTLKAQLVKRFNTKDMGESKWILGMRIRRDRKLHTITLDQELYITKALEKYGLAECKVADTPEVVGAAQQQPSEAQRKPADRQRFMEITGTLMYAAISTRPDIAHAVHYLASNMLAPAQLHMVAAERVLRYLAGTRDVGLVFGSRNGDAVGDSRGWRTEVQVDVCAFSDADWANSKVDRKSVTGWVAKLNGDTVSWASKKQRTVALSTCEAELYAKAAAIQEVLWLRGMMAELGLRTAAGSRVHGDNQSAIAVAKNGIKGERTKHVDVKYHFVTEAIDDGQVQLQWVSTHHQQADIFTKALAAPAFAHFRKLMMSA